MTTLTTTVFVASMTAALIWDLRTRRLPNALTVGALALALILRAPLGSSAVLAGLGGAGLALLLSIPLFAAGGIGGGDVKLLAAVGAFLGPMDLVWASLAAAILGGVLALGESIRQRMLFASLVNTKAMIVHALTLGRAGYARTLESPQAVTVPYGVAIVLGALMVWF